jgi:plastocyanin
MMLTRRALTGAIGLLLPAAVHAADATVTIDNFVFTPAEITIKAGTKLVWINHDDIPHAVVSAVSPPIFRSKALDTDDGYAFVFDKPGRYPYFCSLHPHMQGVVVVT